MARPMKSRAALAAAAALALLLAWAAPSAAQDAVDVAAVDFAATPGEQLQADAPSSSQFVVVDVVHTNSRVNIKKAMATRTIKERSLQLTREQVASLLAASSAAPAADAPGVESAASYAPESGGAVPLSQGITGYSFADTRVSGNEFNSVLKPTGKVLMTFGGKRYMCSASLIGKSLLVTAAHCVWDWDTKKNATDVVFVPNYDVATPSTNVEFKALKFMVPPSYTKRTDTCVTDALGVVCANDVALVWLDLNNGKQAFQVAGNRYYNYLVNAFEATTAPAAGFAGVTVPKYLAITQLGYPYNWDSGRKMQMSNSPGFQLNTAVGTKTVKSIVRGSSLQGGSSGGPWLINLGVDATSSNGGNYGSVSLRNAVVAVTSWGYEDDENGSYKFQGASMFAINNEYPRSAYGTRGGGNIGALVDFACDSAAGVAAGWGLQAKGFCR
ncbi:hypothetical protein Rsub_03651 [Raphidocelis subcapitata]|uniref:Peptidase S1 domain-containing protein n=1 Tax=Raphidocelis subcapitata TaxID=307507 RepID=A0A2V0NUM8_9CHLO|nr:hypothetical protein Rsub_03651 [Raphidocelis subcapitata]|eukprot:GBF91331.1 hypothetical protein Rsub_03651 [Raphidocelis subcapitata]